MTMMLQMPLAGLKSGSQERFVLLRIPRIEIRGGFLRPGGIDGHPVLQRGVEAATHDYRAGLSLERGTTQSWCLVFGV